LVPHPVSSSPLAGEWGFWLAVYLLRAPPICTLFPYTTLFRSTLREPVPRATSLWCSAVLSPVRRARTAPGLKSDAAGIPAGERHRQLLQSLRRPSIMRG